MSVSSVRLRKKLQGAFSSSRNEGSSTVTPCNITLTVKSAPPRTAKVMNKCSIRSGFMTKRNEQSIWQRRYCALVPHTFLYYFDSDEAESPRGIIDLEYYTNISADEKHVIKIATQDALTTRTFYFEAENEAETTEWIAALNRERYFAVREERDAYMDLQNEFSSQFRQTSEAMNAAAQEKQDVQSQLSAERRSSINHLGQVKGLLMKMAGGNSQQADEMTPFEDFATALGRIEKVFDENEGRWHERLRDTETRIAVIGSEEAAHMIEYQKQSVALRRDVEAANKASEAEKQARQAEVGKERERREKLAEEFAVLREQLQLMQANFAQSQINLQVASTQQKTLEAKIIDLIAEKRVLIKEFKATRAFLDKSRKVNKKLLGAYDSLEKKYHALKVANEELVGTGGGSMMTEGKDVLHPLSPSGSSLSLELKLALEHSVGSDESGDLDTTSSSAFQCMPEMSRRQSSSRSSKILEKSSSSRAMKDSSNTPSASPAPGLGSLLGGPAVPPQPLLDLSPPPPAPSSASSNDGRSISPLLLPSRTSSPLHSSFTAGGASVVLKGFGSKLRGLINEVESIDEFLFPSTEPPPSLSSSSSSAPTSSSSSSSSQPQPTATGGGNQPPVPPPSAGINILPLDGGPPPSALPPLLCRRCGGTVEGPKLSTCKCAEPVLVNGPVPPSTAATKLTTLFSSMFTTPTGDTSTTTSTSLTTAAASAEDSSTSDSNATATTSAGGRGNGSSSRSRGSSWRALGLHLPSLGESLHRSLSHQRSSNGSIKQEEGEYKEKDAAIPEQQQQQEEEEGEGKTGTEGEQGGGDGDADSGKERSTDPINLSVDGVDFIPVVPTSPASENDVGEGGKMRQESPLSESREGSTSPSEKDGGMVVPSSKGGNASAASSENKEKVPPYID